MASFLPRPSRAFRYHAECKFFRKSNRHPKNEEPRVRVTPLERPTKIKEIRRYGIKMPLYVTSAEPFVAADAIVRQALYEQSIFLKHLGLTLGWNSRMAG